MSEDRNEGKKNLKKYGLYGLRNIRSAFLNEDDGTNIEDKQSVISITMLFVVFILSFLLTLIMWPKTIIPIITALIPLGIVGVFILNSAIFKEKSVLISNYSVSFLLLLYVFFVYIHTGGFSGISSLWMIFLITFTALSLRGFHRINMILVEIASLVALGLLSEYRANIVAEIVSESKLIMSIFSLIVITLFIVTVIVFQTRIVESENRKNILLQKELTDNNQNLVARNAEIISINENLEELTDQLNEALTSQKLFTASMNHELRAPLNGVMGGLQVLRNSDNLTPGQREIVEASFHSSNALVHIVNDLLDYAKIEAGEFEIIKDNFNIKEISKESSMLLSNMIREKGLSFEFDFKEGTPEILYGDGVRIQQIISNLISNAVKYTHKGSILFSVDVQDNNLIIIVKDTGEGISDEAMEILFTPFKRINEGEHKKIQGTGLGLYVTHNLVHQMCGTISVESKLGEGSTFTVVIPVEVVSYTNRGDSKPGDKKKVDFSDKKLLCVDDSNINLLVFEQLIGKITGAQITTAASGMQALKILETDTFDIIFLDIQMSEMDGIQTLINIRERGIGTPIVALTGESGKDKEVKYMSLGFNGFVTKPMKPNELIEKIIRLNLNP